MSSTSSGKPACTSRTTAYSARQETHAYPYLPLLPHNTTCPTPERCTPSCSHPSEHTPLGSARAMSTPPATWACTVPCKRSSISIGGLAWTARCACGFVRAWSVKLATHRVKQLGGPSSTRPCRMILPAPCLVLVRSDRYPFATGGCSYINALDHLFQPPRRRSPSLLPSSPSKAPISAFIRYMTWWGCSTTHMSDNSLQFSISKLSTSSPLPSTSVSSSTRWQSCRRANRKPTASNMSIIKRRQPGHWFDP